MGGRRAEYALRGRRHPIGFEGVSAQQQSTFYSIGIYHFDQIAAWTPENVAWINNYLRLRGRIDDEDWVDQAASLARELAGA